MKYVVNILRILIVISISISISFNSITAFGNLSNTQSASPTVHINLEPYSTIYEGDIINCTITGTPTFKYWTINNQSKHTTFYNDYPIIFDPEPTPLDTNYVDLTVYAENNDGNDFDTVKVIVKRLFFGDIHYHSWYSDGQYSADATYRNAINDNYLDFICLSDHAEIIDAVEETSPNPIRDRIQFALYNLFKRSEWQLIKNKAIKYYDPGKFTTFLGFEWSASAEYPGGYPDSSYGHEDVSHINFYYRDIYPDAPKFSAWDKYNYDDIFQAMSQEWDKGHLNLGFPHHPLIDNGIEINTVNWTYFADGMVNTSARDKILRGVEVYSCWGTSIGKFSDIPITWPYLDKNLYDQTDAWVENAMWEWSENNLKYRKFALMASSDIHFQSRPGCAIPCSLFWRTIGRPFAFHPDNPAGIIAVYSVHNTREEIWDAMYNCSMYGSQILKTRANVRFDGKIAYGQWINCTSPLKIQIAVQSTFPGVDSSGKSMCPYGYSTNELDYPIQDIWIIKKDRDNVRPNCKLIAHDSPNKNLAVFEYEDYDVKQNDFYYVAIRQKGQNLKNIFSAINPDAPGDEYMIFIGPIFIDSVTSE